MRSRLVALALLVIASLTTTAAQAQVEVSPGVARISLVHGEVSTQRGDSGDWSAAALNAPIVSGDRVSTGESSRAEVQLDYANILRLDRQSQATIASLTRTEIQIQVGQGVVNYDVFKQSEARAEIDTPNVAVHPGRVDGSVRIEVRPDGTTEVIVRKGEVEVATPQGSTHVGKGEMVTVRGTGDQTQYRTSGAPDKDEWDRWNRDRDSLIHNAQSWGRTNRYYTGSEDLDAYGSWRDVPDYGPVWFPAAGPGWVPYRSGRWVWEPYWGWTWVSYEPWGWAPYHYGRWFVYGGSWGWWPGAVYTHRAFYRPVWAPAYVSFFGFGGGGGVSVGFGSFGWLPIGPCDRFYPWWGGHRNHFNVVNVTNITVINNNFHGRSFGGFAPLHGGTRFSNLRLASTDGRIREGISSVPADHFGRGVAARPIDSTTFRGGRMMTGNLPVVPSRDNLRASNQAASPSTMRGMQNQHFFSKARPVAAPQSFDHQATQLHNAIQRSGRFTPVSQARNAGAGNEGRSFTPGSAGTNGGRPVPTAQMPNANGNGPNNGRSNESPANNGGWGRFGRQTQNTPQTAGQDNRQNGMRPTPAGPAQPAQAQSPRTNEGGDRGGWRSFGNRGGQQNEGSPASMARPSTPISSPRSNPQAAPAPAPRQNQPSQDGWRRFSGPGNSENRGQPGSNMGRPSGGNSPAPQQQQPPSSGRSSGGWQPFTSQPQQQPRTAPQDRGRSSNGDAYSRPNGNGGGRSGWWGGGRSSNSQGGYSAPRNESRPPLDMRQPVVTPRSSGGNPGGGGRPSGGGGGYNGGGGNRGGGNSGGGHNAPSGGGQHAGGRR